MKSYFEIAFKKINLISTCSKDTTSNSRQLDPNLRGRDCPRKSLENGSRQTKKRRSKELQSKYSQEELINAIVPPNNTQDFNKSKNKFSKDLINYIWMVLIYGYGHDESKFYEHLRKYNAQYFGSKQCPSYKKLQAAKIDRYPHNITITKKGAEIKLQALLDHTVLRIISSIIATDLQKIDCEDFVLYMVNGVWMVHQVNKISNRNGS